MRYAATWTALLVVLVVLTGCSTVRGLQEDVGGFVDTVGGGGAAEAVSTGLGLGEALGGGGVLTALAAWVLRGREKSKRTKAEAEASAMRKVVTARHESEA